MIIIKIDFFNNKIVVKVNTFYRKLLNCSSNDQCKKILYLIKQRYNYNIYGSYDVSIFYDNEFVSIFVFIKKNDEDYYYNHIDINIVKEKSTVIVNIKDVMLNKKYKNMRFSCKKLNIRDVLNLCEYYYVDTNLQ